MTKPTRTEPATDVDAAQAELDRLLAEHRTWRARADELSAQLDAAEGTLGEHAVEAGAAKVGELGRELAGLRAECDVVTGACIASYEQCVAAWRRLCRAQAAELRAQATAKRAEGADHQEHTAVLLRELAAHEGCEYVPARPSGSNLSRDAQGVALQVGPTPSMPIPKSARLRAEADALDAEAMRVETAEPARSGKVVADDVDELVARLDEHLLAAPPMPSTVRAWCADQLARLEHECRHRPQVREALSVRWSLSWQGGEIASDSGCELRRARLIRTSPRIGAEGPDGERARGGHTIEQFLSIPVTVEQVARELEAEARFVEAEAERERQAERAGRTPEPASR